MGRKQLAEVVGEVNGFVDSLPRNSSVYIQCTYLMLDIFIIQSLSDN